MPDCIQQATLPSLPGIPGRTEGSHKGLCAALLGATMLAALPGAVVTPAAAQPAQKPNILFIMGDDIGWMQPSIYHRGLMVGETPNIDRIGNEGAIFMTYYAEQSCTAGRNAFFTGMNPLRTGMIPPQLPGSPSYLRPGTPALAKFLLDLGYNTGEFGKNHLGRPHRRAADRARLPGILGLPVSPRRDAGRELPGHQQDPDPADRRPAVQEHADPRRLRKCRARWIRETTICLTPPRPVLCVQVLRRHGEEPDVQGRGPADPRAIEEGGRGNLGQGHRLPRPQRSQEDQQAVLRLVQPGAHARHDRAERQVHGHGRRARRQGLGRQRSRHEADG